MTPDTRAMLSRLPVEILDVIMDSLDTPSLLALGKVTPVLCRVMLRRILGPDALEQMFSRSELMIGPGAPTMLVPAIASAPWLPKITTISYFAARDDTHHFIDDVRGLSILLSQLIPGTLEILRLEITVDQTLLSMQRCGAEHPRMPNSEEKQVWVEALVQLMGGAISAGCSRIEISNGPLPGYMYWHNSPPRSFSDGRSVVSRFLHGVAKPFVQYKRPAPTTLGLKSLTFSTGLFFMDSFLSHTLELLHRASGTIQHATISPSADHNLECSYWTWWKLSTFMRLPHLRSLVFRMPSGTLLSQGHLLKFLSNHPNITFLTVDFYLTWTNVDEVLVSVKDDHPVLPKLEILEAWPQFISWLVPLLLHDREQGSFRTLFGGQRRSPSLKSVRILTRGYVAWDKPGRSLDNAILAPNILLSRGSDSTNEDSDIMSPRYPFLVLQINFKASFWIRWLRSRAIPHNALAKSKITNLTLDIDSPADLLSDSPAPIPIIADWLAVFPSLRELVILGQPFTNQSVNERLCEAIVEKCRRLRKLRFNDNVILLPRDGTNSVGQK